VKKHPLVTYFACVFALTWGIGAAVLFAPSLVRVFISGPALTNPLFYLAVYAPTITSLILTTIEDGTSGLKRLFARLIPWRVSVLWYVVILIGFPAVGMLAGLASLPFGAWHMRMPDWGQFYYSLIPALTIDPGPLGEELGWRGFVLPRMLKRWPPFSASVILGMIWGIWHLPAFFIVGLPHKDLAFLALLTATVSVSIVDTWIFLRTDGNVLLMILVHLMTNNCFKALGIPFGTSVAAGAICASVIVLAGGTPFRTRGSLWRVAADSHPPYARASRD
jgi:uncharacterized protein